MIVSCNNLNKIYRSRGGDVHALRDVVLSVNKGQMLAVMGASGSGKTTLLNVMSGLDRATSGEVVIAGENIENLSDNALTEYRARHMGFVFQSYNLLPVLTALENVELAAILAGNSGRVARKMSADKLEMVGLKDFIKHKTNELSGGQQQRVTIARALVNDPEVVWADEPTGNLDSANEKDVMDLFARLNAENNQTFIMVTHRAPQCATPPAAERPNHLRLDHQHGGHRRLAQHRGHILHFGATECV